MDDDGRVIVTRRINGEDRPFDVTNAHRDFQVMNLETVRRIATGTARYKGDLVDSHIRTAAGRVYRERSGGKDPRDPYGNAQAAQ